MKCNQCESGRRINKLLNEPIEIPGGPTLLVRGVEGYECEACGDIILKLSVAKEVHRRALAALVVHYFEHPDQLRGKVANWIRTTIGMTVPELITKIGDKDPETYFKRVQRNSKLDRYAALVLLALATDFLRGDHAAMKQIDALSSLSSLVQKDTTQNVDLDFSGESRTA